MYVHVHFIFYIVACYNVKPCTLNVKQAVKVKRKEKKSLSGQKFTDKYNNVRNLINY